MKNKKSLIIVIPLILILIAAAFLIFREERTGSVVSYKEHHGIQEIDHYFTVEADQTKRIAFLKETVKKYFKAMEVHRAYQDWMTQFGEFPQIFKEYTDYTAQYPNDPMFQYLLGRVHNDASAEKYYQSCLELDPNYYWGHLGLAYYYFNDCAPPKTDLAKEHLNKALGIDKTKPHAYFSLLSIYRREKKSDKMLETLEILTKFLPDRDYLFIDYADLKYPDRNDFKKALERKLRDIPNSGMIKKALADMLIVQGKTDEALRYLESGLSDEKYNPALLRLMYYEIAGLYAKKKDVPKALSHIKDAVKNGYVDYASIKANKDFDFMRDHEEFKSLVKSLEPVKKEPPQPAPAKKK
jgi:tetratricopeptide (TPR) repeat protein